MNYKCKNNKQKQIYCIFMYQHHHSYELDGFTWEKDSWSFLGKKTRQTSNTCNTRGATGALPAFEVKIDMISEVTQVVQTWKHCRRQTIPQLHSAQKEIPRKPHSRATYPGDMAGVEVYDVLCGQRVQRQVRDRTVPQNTPDDKCGREEETSLFKASVKTYTDHWVPNDSNGSTLYALQVRYIFLYNS